MKYSTTSKKRLKTCHKDLQTILNYAINVTSMDMGIACGHRSINEQKRLYDQGRKTPGKIVTYVDGINVKSKHNYLPSLAVDVFAWVGKVSWEKEDMIFLAGVIMTSANYLYNQGKIEHKLRWGGNFDMDEIIVKDQKFIDLPHYELIT